MKISGAIFDLDGTLFDSMPVWKHFGEKYLRDMGFTPEEGLRDLVKTYSLRESAAYFREKYHINYTEDEIMQQINDMIVKQYKEVLDFKPHAREFVQHLYQQGVEICICTATSSYIVQTALQRLQCEHYFKFIISCDEAGPKSQPAIFEEALQRLGTAKEKTMVFEDSLYAIKTAKNAGFAVTALYDEAAAEDAELIKSIADLYLVDFSQWQE